MNSLARAEAAQRRHTILKLQKDFERVKPIVLNMFNDVAKLNVFQPGSNSGGSRSKRSQQDRTDEPKLMQAVVVGQDVDELIMAEREQDILRLNRDISLVNEMFKYGDLIL